MFTVCSVSAKTRYVAQFLQQALQALSVSVIFICGADEETEAPRGRGAPCSQRQVEHEHRPAAPEWALRPPGFAGRGDSEDIFTFLSCGSSGATLFKGQTHKLLGDLWMCNFILELRDVSPKCALRDCKMPVCMLCSVLKIPATS